MSGQEHLRAIAGYALDRRLRRVEAQAILAAAYRLEASDHAHRNAQQRLLLLEAAQVDETVAHGLRSPVSGALVPGSVQTERRCGDCGRVYVAGSPGWRKVGGLDSCPTCRAKNPAGWLAKAADGIVRDLDAGGAS